ncbi:MAG: tRNA lysidine(34) synthetase TilS [Pedobacter sp.]|nr:tRNA lysidine(34) synthetase TilS [Chitinophagaceae bacterium]
MLLEKFKKYIVANYQLSATSCHFLLAVSGGVDSVVMVDLFAKAGFDFSIAHCNFQLRGNESLRDELFVKQLGEHYQKQVFVKQFDTLVYAEGNKVSIQVAARELRYGWFAQIVDSWQLAVDSTTNNQKSTINFIATAHHADDNIETLLLNFFRGCGISGLHGILPKQGNLIRPLLFAKREDIIAYAKEQSLTWVEDSSNASNKYSRNFIRHQIIPLMQTIYPQVTDNLMGNIERFKEVEMIYNQSINQTKNKLLEVKGNEIHIPILKLKKQTPLRTIVYEIILNYGFASTQVEEVVKLLNSANGSFMSSASHRLIINRNWLIIAPVQSSEATNILIENGTQKVDFVNGRILLKLSTVNRQPSTDFGNQQAATSNQIATLNADVISFPLLLRPYKTGDYFYPLGMSKKKKLSKFFIDLKLSKTDKEKVWVLESDKRIIWVVGYRIDNRFKLLPTTQNGLIITYENNLLTVG